MDNKVITGRIEKGDLDRFVSMLERTSGTGTVAVDSAGIGGQVYFDAGAPIAALCGRPIGDAKGAAEALASLRKIPRGDVHLGLGDLHDLRHVCAAMEYDVPADLLRHLDDHFAHDLCLLAALAEDVAACRQIPIDESLRLLKRRPYVAVACCDCDVDTTEIGEFDYRLRDDVWLAANGRVRGVLCIGCVENRLGRELTEADFVLRWTSGRSARLMARLRNAG